MSKSQLKEGSSRAGSRDSPRIQMKNKNRDTSPRKFSEKIAFHTQAQDKGNAEFERIIKEVRATKESRALNCGPAGSAAAAQSRPFEPEQSSRTGNYDAEGEPDCRMISGLEEGADQVPCQLRAASDRAAPEVRIPIQEQLPECQFVECRSGSAMASLYPNDDLNSCTCRHLGPSCQSAASNKMIGSIQATHRARVASFGSAVERRFISSQDWTWCQEAEKVCCCWQKESSSSRRSNASLESRWLLDGEQTAHNCNVNEDSFAWAPDSPVQFCPEFARSTCIHHASSKLKPADWPLVASCGQQAADPGELGSRFSRQKSCSDPVLGSLPVARVANRNLVYMNATNEPPIGGAPARVGHLEAGPQFTGSLPYGSKSNGNSSPLLLCNPTKMEPQHDLDFILVDRHESGALPNIGEVNFDASHVPGGNGADIENHSQFACSRLSEAAIPSATSSSAGMQFHLGGEAHLEPDAPVGTSRAQRPLSIGCHLAPGELLLRCNFSNSLAAIDGKLMLGLDGAASSPLVSRSQTHSAISDLSDFSDLSATSQPRTPRPQVAAASPPRFVPWPPPTDLEFEQQRTSELVATDQPPGELYLLSQQGSGPELECEQPRVGVSGVSRNRQKEPASVVACQLDCDDDEDQHSTPSMEEALFRVANFT